jgi:hypothetical protein
MYLLIFRHFLYIVYPAWMFILLVIKSVVVKLISGRQAKLQRIVKSV